MDEQLTDTQRNQLLTAARRSIDFGLRLGEPLEIDPDNYSGRLREKRATFVTLLTRERDLRGCIGTLEPQRPLVSDVAHNAFSAASRDPRFPPITEAEYAHVSIQVSVLSLPEPIEADTEEALLRQLRPGVDGLILEAGSRRATFLPSVWESLPQPREFVSALKRKAGIVAHTPEPLICWRYTTESFSDE